MPNPQPMAQDSIGARIKALRNGRNLSQARLAALIGTDQSTVALWEKGRTLPREDKVEEVAKVLFTTPQYLRYGEDASVAGDGDRDLEITGTIEIGNIIKDVPVSKRRPAPVPPVLSPGDPVPNGALIVSGASMYPSYRDGDVLFYSKSPDLKASGLIGMECVIQVKDGQRFVKRLSPGTRRGRYTLASSNTPDMRDVEIEWCAPVVWVWKNLAPSR